MELRIEYRNRSASSAFEDYYIEIKQGATIFGFGELVSPVLCELDTAFSSNYLLMASLATRNQLGFDCAGPVDAKRQEDSTLV
jgi:hypothetical protein